MLIIHLTLCALLMSDVMFLPSQEEGQSGRSTQEAPDLVNAPPIRIKRELSSREEEMTGRTTQDSPTSEGGTHVDLTRGSPTIEGEMQVDVTQQSPATEVGMQVEVTLESPVTTGEMHVDVTKNSPLTEVERHVEVTQESPTTEGTIHVDVTQESPTTECGMQVEVTQESPTTEGGMQEEVTQESPVTTGGMHVAVTQDSPLTEVGKHVEVTQESPTTESTIHVDVTHESPITECGMDVEVTQEAPTTEGGMHVNVTQESPITEGGMHVEVTQESFSTESGMRAEVSQEAPSQSQEAREISTDSSEPSFLSDVSLTPYRWLCTNIGLRKLSIKVHCNCDPLCVLYDDCCYGVIENATVCAASVRLTSAQNTFDKIAGTSLRETDSNSTTSTASRNNTSSWIREINQRDPVSISLAHKSSCRKIPTLHRQNSQSKLGEKDTLGLRYWMVDQCPPSLLEEESSIKCTNTSNTGITENVLLYQPVTDPDTMITFRNKYCAACNGVKHGGEPWELVVYGTRVAAERFVNCDSSDCVLRELEAAGSSGIFAPKPDWNLRTCFGEAENDAFRPCKFRFVNGSMRRVPRPLPLHSALRDACMAYNNPVAFSIADEIYKNFHCMLCYVGDYTICGVENTTLPPERFFGLSFRALLYLGDQDKEQGDDEMPFNQQIMCPPGFVPDDQGCRALMYNFTVVQSIVPLHFEPCGWAPTPIPGCMGIEYNDQLRTVLSAVQAGFHLCRHERSADNRSITLVVETMVTLRVPLAHYEEGRNLFNQVQAWMENALEKVLLETSGGPLGIRKGSFSACTESTTRHDSVPPFSGTTAITTPSQNRGNSHDGNVTLLMLMAMVATVCGFYSSCSCG